MNRSIFGTLLTPVIAGMLLGAGGASIAADVSNYAVRKGMHYEQDSAAAPSPVPFTSAVFSATVMGNLDAITEVTVTTPSPFVPGFELTPNDAGTALEIMLPAQSMNDLNLFAPNGQYMFVITSENDGDSFAPLDLSSSTLPGAIPYITDYTGAQAISAAANYTLTFNEQTGATGNDHFEFRILDLGVEIFSISGTGTSVVIPAGTLEPDSTYQASLRFVRELQRDTSTYPGAIGTAELYTQTEFTLGTGQGGGGGNDTTPPLLALSAPQTGATNVAVNSTVTFTFNEPMANTYSIEWSANVNATGLSYSWVNGGTTLGATSRGAFPPNSVITWKLNSLAADPANFRDLAGNQLASATYQGSFTTGEAGTVDPCEPGTDDGSGFGSIFKSLQYVQTSNAAPVLDTTDPASFGANYRSATNQNVTAVRLSGAGGNIDLTNLFGFFIASRGFNTPAQLETAFPAGNYTITATGAGAATLAIGSTAQLPVPQINNFSALASMDVTKSFTLTFAPFTGAGANDSIFINISGATGQGEFHAPDPCRNIELPNTATSIVIPANTFKAGQSYNGSISFSRNSFDTNSILNTGVSGGVNLTTTFGFTISGVSQPTPPMWTTIARNQDGTVTYTILGDTGLNIAIEASDTITGGWAQLTSAVLTTGSHQFTIDPRTPSRRFYRARVL